MAIGFKEQTKGRVFWGKAYFQTPPFPSQPGSPRLGGGRHILNCDLLLHLGMARCHVPSSWQTAVKESSTWFPCLSRGRGAISKGGTAAPILPFPTWQVVQRQFSNSQTSAPLWMWLSSFSLARMLRPELYMGALSHTGESQRKG